MESSFRHDFRGVRIHSGGRASALAGAHDALAVTVGSDVFFGRDAPAPKTPSGRLVLAHELAHVAQNERPQRSRAASGRELEREAAGASLRALAGRRAEVGWAGDGAPRALGRGWKYLLYGLGGAAVGGLLGLGAAALGAAALLPALLGGLIGGAAGGVTAAWATERREADMERLLEQRRQIDLWIDGAYGQDLPNRLTADQAERARWRVVEEREFKRAYEVWGRGSLAWDRVGGFVDRSTQPPTVHIRVYHNNPFVRLHEAVHLYSHRAMRGQTPNLLEGATDYFARPIARREGIGITSNYERQFRVVDALVGIVGEPLLRRAYFQGDVLALRRAATAAGVDWQRDIVQGGLANRPRPAPRPAPPSPPPPQPAAPQPPAGGP